MTLEIGSKVIHPSYPHWGEGTVIDLEYPTIQFDEPEGGKRKIAKENLTDVYGRSLADPVVKARTKSQLRQEANDRAAAAKIEKDEREKTEYEESIRAAVEYLVGILGQVSLGKAYSKTQEQADELEKHFESYGVDLKVIVDPRLFSRRILLYFPVLIDNPPPFPVITRGKAGFRGPSQKRMPQGMIRYERSGHHVELCNTEIALRLIERGLKYKA